MHLMVQVRLHRVIHKRSSGLLPLQSSLAAWAAWITTWLLWAARGQWRSLWAMDLSTCISPSKSCTPKAGCGSPGPGMGRTAQRSRDGAWPWALLPPQQETCGTASSAASSPHIWAALEAARFAPFCGPTASGGAAEIQHTQLNDLILAQGSPSIQCPLLAGASQRREPSHASLCSPWSGDFQSPSYMKLPNQFLIMSCLVA